MEYYQLNAANLLSYLASLPSMQQRFLSFAPLQVTEVNDGNMNYAFVVKDPRQPTQSIFVKQAPPYIKVLGKDWPLTQERMSAEIKTLSYHGRVCPTMVPKIYYQSQTMSVLIMEYLSDHNILRTELIKGVYLPHLAEHLSSFLAQSLFQSSDFALSSAAKKALIQQHQNKDMCLITEDFVFTYAFEHHEMNDYNPHLSQQMIDSIQKDPEVRAQVAQMKYLYTTQAETLLHGDLHTSSIMVNAEQSLVIDPEFSFVGPMGFDLGALIGNLYLCYFSHACGSSKSSVDYSEWLLQNIEQIWLKFADKFMALWSTHESSAQKVFMGEDLLGQGHQAFRAWYMTKLLSDTLGFAACKMCRRVLGVAKVADLMQFEDLHLRAKLEAQVLTLAKKILLDRAQFSQISQVNALARNISSGS